MFHQMHLSPKRTPYLTHTVHVLAKTESVEVSGEKSWLLDQFFFDKGDSSSNVKSKPYNSTYDHTWKSIVISNTCFDFDFSF